MWDSLPWFVQLAIEIGAVLFLWNVGTEAVIRTMKLLLLLKLDGLASLKAYEKIEKQIDDPRP